MKTIMIIVGALLAGVCFASQPEFAFKGYKPGMNYSEFKNSPQFDCKDFNTPLADKACIQNHDQLESIAGVKATRLTLGFYGDKLHAINITFPSENFTNVKEALTLKFGTGESERNQVQNRMGVTFENEIITWTNNSAMIVLTQRSGSINVSSYMIETLDGIEEYKVGPAKHPKAA